MKTAYDPQEIGEYVRSVQVEAILTARNEDEIWEADQISNQSYKADDILNELIIIENVWTLTSDWENSTLILATFNDQRVFVIIRGNAGRQALYMKNKDLLPAKRILKATLAKGHARYHWSRTETV